MFRRSPWRIGNYPTNINVEFVILDRCEHVFVYGAYTTPHTQPPQLHRLLSERYCLSVQILAGLSSLNTCICERGLQVGGRISVTVVRTDKFDDECVLGCDTVWL
jgi:hypothetical protein